MALTRSPVYTLSLAYRDNQGKTATVQFYAATTNLMADLITIVEDTLIPKVNALVNAACVGWSITSSASDPDVATATISEDSNVKEKAVFSFRAENGAPYVIGVPSPKGEIVTAGGNVVNLSHAAVADFVATVIGGVSGSFLFGTTRPRSYLGSDIRSLIKAEFKTRQ